MKFLILLSVFLLSACNLATHATFLKKLDSEKVDSIVESRHNNNSGEYTVINTTTIKFENKQIKSFCKSLNNSAKAGLYKYWPPFSFMYI
jgi:hypothetical protein